MSRKSLSLICAIFLLSVAALIRSRARKQAEMSLWDIGSDEQQALRPVLSTERFADTLVNF